MQPWRDRLCFQKKKFSKLTGALVVSTVLSHHSLGNTDKEDWSLPNGTPLKLKYLLSALRNGSVGYWSTFWKKHKLHPKVEEVDQNLWSRWRWSCQCHVPIIEKSSSFWRLSHYNLNVDLHFPRFADSAESADSGVFAQLRLNLATGTTGATRATGEARFSPSVAWKRLPSDSTNLI